jgi:hypothetical protein
MVRTCAVPVDHELPLQAYIAAAWSVQHTVAKKEKGDYQLTLVCFRQEEW